MPLGYQPKDAPEDTEFESLPPGTYSFKIDEASEGEWKKVGCLKLKLLVAIGNKDYTVFDNLYYAPINPGAKSPLWKLRQLSKCVGFDFDNPPEVHEIENRFGSAEFDVGPKGYLQVKRYIESDEATAKGNGESVAADNVPW